MRRRDLLTGGGALAIASLVPLDTALAQGLVTRRSVNQPEAAADLEAYGRAVAIMKAKPADDPLSWTSLASIHQQRCPHRNWYFLPWHRAYLAAFERACRNLSGKADFALPYWDWFIDRQLPEPFRGSANSGNILWEDRPGFPENASLPIETFGEATLERILASEGFEAFGSSRPFNQNSLDSSWQRKSGASTELEFGPHNNVHGILLGVMVSGLSPLDPIFWLHHCNVDRIWSLWTARHPTFALDELFLGFEFANDFTAVASDVPARVQKLLNTERLGYSYPPLLTIADVAEQITLQRVEAWQSFDTSILGNQSGFVALQGSGVGAGNGLPILVAKSTQGGIATRTQPLSIPFIAQQPIETLLGDLGNEQSGSAVVLTGPRRVVSFSRINFKHPPTDPGGRVHIFLNCDYLSPAIGPGDPHYVTTIAFFAGHDDHGEVTVQVDLTDTLATVRRNGDLTGKELVVQLMPAQSDDVEGSAVEVTSMTTTIL